MPLTHDIGVRIPYPLPRATVIVAFFITDSPEQRDKGRRTPFEQTEQRDPDELRSSRRVVTFEDRRSEINSLSTTENNCNRHFLFCTPRLRYKDRESRFEPDAQRSNAKTVYLDARQRTPDIEEAHLAVLRPQLLPKSRRIKNIPKSDRQKS